MYIKYTPRPYILCYYAIVRKCDKKLALRIHLTESVWYTENNVSKTYSQSILLKLSLSVSLLINLAYTSEKHLIKGCFLFEMRVVVTYVPEYNKTSVHEITEAREVCLIVCLVLMCIRYCLARYGLIKIITLCLKTTSIFVEINHILYTAPKFLSHITHREKRSHDPVKFLVIYSK